MAPFVSDFLQRTFSSLSVPNFRKFFYGQAVSMSGMWMQSVAQGLLVLRLTGSGTDLGLVVALQTLPVLFLAPYAGVTIDRLPKRSILYVTQVAFTIISLSLGLAVLTDAVQLWMVYVAAVLSGIVNSFDNPTRQTLVREMVGKDLLVNAVSLNSLTINVARVIGPSLAGFMVATVGLGWCFVFNGVSYLAVLGSLLSMDASALQPAARASKAKGQLRDGLAYVRRESTLRTVLLMMAIIGTFTYEFQVVLPLFAEFTFHNGASGFAALTASMGVGAVIGGVYTAGRRGGSMRRLVISAALFGGSVLLAALAPTFHIAVLAMVVVGFFSINFTSLGNVTLQLNARGDMQGRVMSLWTMAFLGTTPIGGPIMGAFGEHVGARPALLVGGLAALVAAGLGMSALRHRQRQHDAVEAQHGRDERLAS